MSSEKKVTTVRFTDSDLKKIERIKEFHGLTETAEALRQGLSAGVRETQLLEGLLRKTATKKK